MKQLLFLLSALLVFSCNSKQEHDHDHDQQQHEHQQEQQTADILQLNDGEKWLVNEEMKPFIEESETLLNNYITSDGTDYQALAEQIKEQNSQLIKSCTMDGKSHDELHKWLHPHIDFIEDLGNASDVEASKNNIEQLKSSFETYKEYFQ